MNVLVLGASANPEKYSFKAVSMLHEHGHKVFPVHPSGKTVGSHACNRSIEDVSEKIDTLTLYVGPKTSDELTDSILALKPRRIIFNPGSENPTLAAKAAHANIETIEGCTLVMLKTGQF